MPTNFFSKSDKKCNQKPNKSGSETNAMEIFNYFFSLFCLFFFVFLFCQMDSNDLLWNVHLQRFFYFKSEHKISLYSRTDPFKVNELQRKNFLVGRRQTNRVGCIDVFRLPFEIKQLAALGVNVWTYSAIHLHFACTYTSIHAHCTAFACQTIVACWNASSVALHRHIWANCIRNELH